MRKMRKAVWTESGTLGVSQSILIGGVASFQGWICTVKAYFGSGLHTRDVYVHFRDPEVVQSREGVHCIMSASYYYLF